MTLLLRRLFLPVVLIATLLAGCSGMPKDLAGLVVQLDGIRSIRSQAGLTEMVVTVRCYNETLRPIGVRGLQLELSLNGVEVGRAVSAKPLGTQSLSSNTQDVTFVLENQRVVDRVVAAVRSGSLTYDLKSRVIVMAADNEMKSTSKASGTVDVSSISLSLN
ncbi:LEA type 2 family protein [Synoicihabitans lomoniglobus]|uniref:Late embryogenesis abundant protein LEA-2 subgroup domain-containing protein n=1 Tax=Synoicihabitans lomoniglobus TaxID=2909285 RepID=A0AAF0CMB3_9BACT|nr:hypothetical protein [Opitutaceae bacterium LMO-M01]WED63873.1 hypothetical protein PXH66_16160 [Opitutaceae bacterium LMO-M01]